MSCELALIGGGSGSFSILSGLRERPLEIRSIVSMMDSGGDSGELRDAFGVLPPGDLRRCLVALSSESELLRDLFSFRFDEAPLAGRNFGNLFILALTRALGSEREAVEAIAKILKIRGNVLPVTWDHAHLVAELDNGETIHGEAAIDARGRGGAVPERHGPQYRIERVALTPNATANPEVLTTLARCDVIVLAPGDVYTSTIPNFLVSGIPDAIQKTRAPLVYILNLMTKHGETDGWSASRHVEEIARYAGRVPDAVLVHDGPVPAELLRQYADEHAQPVRLDADRLRELGVELVRCADISSTQSVVRHDPTRSADALLRLVGELLDSRRQRDEPPPKGAIARRAAHL